MYIRQVRVLLATLLRVVVDELGHLNFTVMILVQLLHTQLRFSLDLSVSHVLADVLVVGDEHFLQFTLRYCPVVVSVHLVERFRQYLFRLLWTTSRTFAHRVGRHVENCSR